MKSLYDYLNELDMQKVCEAFGSEIMSMLFRGANLSKNQLWKNKLSGMFTWDKMTNDDFKIYEDTEELVKKIYKKSGMRNFVIWCAKDGNILAYSDDLKYDFWDMRHCFDHVRSVRGVAGKVAEQGGFAIEIIDPEKFETSKLREQRRIAKSGALALRDAGSVAQENRLRYEEAVAKAQGNKFNHADIVAKVQSVVDIYTDLLKSMTNDMEILLNIKSWGNPLEDLQNDYQRIVNDACYLLKNGQYVEQWEEENADSLDNTLKREYQNDIRVTLGRMLQEFNTKVAKFRMKYVEK